EVENNAPEVFPLGTTQVTWTLTDENGQIISAQQNVTVTTATGETDYPTILIAPEDITIVADGNSSEITNIDLGTPTAQSCLNYTLTNNAPETYPIGNTIITWALLDENGGVILTAEQIVSVVVYFYLNENGVTCMCPDAPFGASGEVNGVIYTKRTKEQITPQNAATTCTSGITDLSYLFWDVTLNQS
ncbi:DUF2345 domain-containing protein, partial [Psychroflexus sp. C1]|nr:DUF2345 domain-containing protein [Psychroflexus maritimus]